MTASIIPELSVTDIARSLNFYCEILPFKVRYQRPEEGFAFLDLGAGSLMLDQIDLGRSFEASRGPLAPPFGRGLNLQIEVADVAGLVQSLRDADWPLFLELEEKWYRRGDGDVGNVQFVVADPDGYLLRFFQDAGSRPTADA